MMHDGSLCFVLFREKKRKKERERPKVLMKLIK